MTSEKELDELRRTVRKFLAERSAEPAVRRLLDDELGFDPDVWRLLATQLGLQGLAIPEDYGGAGYGLTELSAVFEETGAALLPGPFFATVALAVTCLRLSGDDAACQAYLPGIAAGELIATLAFSETNGGWDDDAIHATAERAAEDWVLTGTKRYVPDVGVAGLLLVAARAPAGISLFAVERGASGLNLVPEPTLDLTRRLGIVALDATPARLIGQAGQASGLLKRTLRIAAVALAAEQVGGSRQILQQAVDYAKTRVQFGRPIGSFQVIKHKLADMFIKTEFAKAALDAAVAAVDADDPQAELAASIAKSFCSDAYYEVAAEAVQIFGGIGFTWEHPAHLYFKRAKASQFLLGSPGFHRDLVGQALGI